MFGCQPDSDHTGQAIPIGKRQKFSVFDCGFFTSDCLQNQINKILPNNFEEDQDVETPICFLEKGILCLGPITRDGCECKCINLGLPCEGCMGPISQDFTADIINFLSMIDLSDDLKNYKGIFYRFSKPKIKGGKY